MPSIAVVTATTGRDTLKQTIESVVNQTVKCKHYIFVDGNISFDACGPGDWCWLPVKTGGNGMMNGGIVAASAYLVQEDLICWLDDDNWIEPDHIETLLAAKGDNPYAYSLRKLVEPDGTFFDYDDFESLGIHSGFIDLNCYLMDRQLAVQLAPLWYKTTGDLMVGDRYVYDCLRGNSLPYGETGKYTVNYRLNPKRDLRPWFFDGNIKNRAKYSGDLPWRK
jgi:glycosyltransferase involved in cell wall biosynthesis